MSFFVPTGLQGTVHRQIRDNLGEMCGRESRSPLQRPISKALPDARNVADGEIRRISRNLGLVAGPAAPLEAA